MKNGYTIMIDGETILETSSPREAAERYIEELSADAECDFYAALDGIDVLWNDQPADRIEGYIYAVSCDEVRATASLYPQTADGSPDTESDPIYEETGSAGGIAFCTAPGKAAAQVCAEGVTDRAAEEAEEQAREALRYTCSLYGYQQTGDGDTYTKYGRKYIITTSTDRQKSIAYTLTRGRANY